MVKEKPNSTRLYDEDGFRKRAACVCVRNDEETEVLLVSGSRDPHKWVVPGGGLEPDEDHSKAAIREVMEEAGVIGKLGRCLGVFENPERKHRTSVFVMVVTDLLEDWDDSKTMGRMRKWFSVDEALSQLAIYKPIQVNYLELLLKNNKIP
ncbi:NUDT3 (predicted) [Pycnogonum litorale]